ncbi:MAG: QueT transporter family protein [Clostridia bacterium]|nr:QueT transporter family protein [Clostridia bacterium]
MKNNKVLFLCQGAMIGTLYVILTLISSVIGLLSTPVRLSEALCVLPYFTSAAVPGLFVGCLISNLILGGAIPDIIFGSLATLLGAAGTYLLRNFKTGKWFASIPPVLSNTIIIPPILSYCYGYSEGWVVIASSIALSEIVSCTLIGTALLFALMPVKNKLFK